VKIGATLIPLVGWRLDTRQPEKGRVRHLGAIRTLVEEYEIQTIELNGDFALLYPQVIDRGYYQQVADLQEELGFICTLHLPFLWLDGASLNEPIRQATMQSMKQVLEAAEPLRVESYVLHLWGVWTSMLARFQDMPPEEKQDLLSAILRRAEYTLAEFGDHVSPASVCVENLPALPFDYIIPLVERQGARICLDVGHLARQGGDVLAFVTEHWEQIGEIHLHDALPEAQKGSGPPDHLPLGEGRVDYVALMQILEERAYDKVLILEVNTEADLLRSLEKVRPWL
jgi:sugar phosphate isomerase/epimerase